MRYQNYHNNNKKLLSFQNSPVVKTCSYQVMAAKVERRRKGTGDRRELGDKSLLMMTPYTWVARPSEIKLSLFRE